MKMRIEIDAEVARRIVKAASENRGTSFEINLGEAFADLIVENLKHERELREIAEREVAELTEALEEQAASFNHCIDQERATRREVGLIGGVIGALIGWNLLDD